MADQETKDVGGRPSLYSPEMADLILAHITEGLSVSEIGRIEGMPARSTIMLWVAQDKEGFLDRYAKACQARAHYWADEILDIADDGCNDWMERTDAEGETIGWAVNGEALGRSKLRVDSRKWLLSKLLPQYSDKQEIKHSGSIDTNRITDEELDARIQSLLP
jgi:hypothetical protein